MFKRWREKRRTSTSENDPLQISPVNVRPGWGKVGITLCPGKKDKDGLSAIWERKMSADLDVVRDWGAQAVVTLLEPREFGLLCVEELGVEVRGRGMKWLHLPIKDLGAPDDAFEKNWPDARDEIFQVLSGGGNVVVHCRGGRGRAGVVACRILVDAGQDPATALRAVRAARPGAVETRVQQDYVTALDHYWAS